MTSFEGSYLGASDKISPRAIMECKICWTPYDPSEGDDSRQVLPGTPFLALPDDWSCPGCNAPKAQFLVREDPGNAEEARIEAQTRALVADFTEIFHAKMRDLPMVNQALHVQAVGFRRHEAPELPGTLGVLIAPWFMNLVLIPDQPLALKPGEKLTLTFPSGAYEFIFNTREQTGDYLACALFSPMGDFTSQLQAVEVAHAVMSELMKSENRAETDRSAEIRARAEGSLTEVAQDEAEPSPPEVPTLIAPTRRALLTGGQG
ncbi:[NiFe]-hydrogenase assembly chaperone HybE [Stagnihabitans tardus]|uniref:[NiFe]-hydrogenase assembly chaperone HybE n=1 Tax=Stagnihabitans tardus TaxID=2699202 RepID=A0AAE5BUU6_9RHOB|nr:[NiFe]-hydrogenase assembly chaperone HybE [Stagnihabitans tardus]NBZ88266.1 [NiFe]-hydrogenase assembly chaperone HybE [Stagnihabitans tardus]